MNYCIGDLQGCFTPLQRLLEKIDFSPSRDTLYLLGDLVNRGPESLAVLRYLSALGSSAQCLLGNHDLHLLAIWQGVREPGRSDTLEAVLQAPDREQLLDWLRHRPMAMQSHGWLMVHAGVLPQWSTAQTMALAAEVEQALRGPPFKDFLRDMYGNLPTVWREDLRGMDRLRVIVNALTRLRFCSIEGEMDFTSNGAADSAPNGYSPWFDFASPASANQSIAFGHWSTLAAGGDKPPVLKHNTLALDTGCLWGGCLTAARIGVAPQFELLQVDCEQSAKPRKKAR
ncbi:Bis(5'-nucleosyl)-tetraphosphatase [symmetrical] [Polaromonas vacuolata]|uniref:Bis(5'-nucleosyl)-tetraphosphatase, symmetrical n=1 Tax=Polaromonas vacuolata TaxID=37448 RepID=A0A6H2HBW8_9BURK|nr:symmetrical bis(5'-nucleosyl)-tetraphosphatase [Polaromonas vacuolata]QJC57369.1 Bis(5'-nucleosyl)-tetraphosphatase [symmetrical] [Polaromonas vacuolata]